MRVLVYYFILFYLIILYQYSPKDKKNDFRNILFYTNNWSMLHNFNIYHIASSINSENWKKKKNGILSESDEKHIRFSTYHL